MSIAEQQILQQKILDHVIAKSGLAKEDIESSEMLETAIARHCIARGAKKICESDLASITGNAQFAPAHPDMYNNYVAINYKSLSSEQVQEMALLLQDGVEKNAVSEENILLISFDHFCTLDLFVAKN